MRKPFSPSSSRFLPGPAIKTSCRLITKMKFALEKKVKASVRHEELEEHAAGLVCLTGGGGMGWLAAALQTRLGVEEARKEN